MRYFVLIGRVVRGPFSEREAGRLAGLSGETPVCPEDRDPAVSGHWTAAVRCQGLLGTGEARPLPADGGAALYWSSALAKAQAAEVLAAAGRPTAARKPAKPGRLLAGTLGVALALAAARAPTAWPRRSPGPAVAADEPVQSRIRRLLPDCASVADAAGRGERIVVFRSGSRARVLIPADGRLLKEDAVFDFDVRRGELRPRSAAARRLLDPRRGCGS